MIYIKCLRLQVKVPMSLTHARRGFHLRPVRSGGTDIFSADDLHHRQNNGRYENYFSKRLQRSSRQKQRDAPLADHTLRI